MNKKDTAKTKNGNAPKVNPATKKVDKNSVKPSPKLQSQMRKRLERKSQMLGSKRIRRQINQQKNEVNTESINNIFMQNGKELIVKVVLLLDGGSDCRHYSWLTKA